MGKVGEKVAQYSLPGMLTNALGITDFGDRSGGKKKKQDFEKTDEYKALQYQKAPSNPYSVPSLMPKEVKINQSRTNSLNAMKANKFGLM